jgi:hypothetical protein
MPTLSLQPEPPEEKRSKHIPATALDATDVTPQGRKDFRKDSGYLFSMYLRTKAGEPRVRVRVFLGEGPKPNGRYLTPEVVMGQGHGLVIFKRGFLTLECPAGPGTEARDRLAVLQALLILPGDPRVPEDFFAGYSNMQIGFLRDQAPEIKRILQAQSES